VMGREWAGVDPKTRCPAREAWIGASVAGRPALRKAWRRARVRDFRRRRWQDSRPASCSGPAGQPAAAGRHGGAHGKIGVFLSFVPPICIYCLPFSQKCSVCFTYVFICYVFNVFSHMCYQCFLVLSHLFLFVPYIVPAASRHGGAPGRIRFLSSICFLLFTNVFLIFPDVFPILFRRRAGTGEPTAESGCFPFSHIVYVFPDISIIF
jgi:hypothetical protein